MAVPEYDVIVVGASFAGLAVARRLSGRVLLVDRHEIGAVQTSACGTPLWVPRALGVEDSVLQVHDRLTLRTPARTVTYDLSAVPFCTFDYGRFCRGLLAQSCASFVRAGVTAMDGEEVVTTEGRFRAPVVVDASGWRGTLVNGPAAAPPARGLCSFGLETRTDLPGSDLAFWLDQRIFPRGLGWVFPVGTGSLIGQGSYTGVSKLRDTVERFARDLGAAPGSYHGTYFPNRLLRSTVGRIFAVGDAAGQCLPLTAEGIRPALYFGGECGALVQAVLEGRLTLADALARYRALVDGYRWAYRVLAVAQWLAAHAPTRFFALVSDLANRRPFRPRWWPRYGCFGRIERAAVPGAS